MSDLLSGILLSLGPTYLCCALALVWAAHSAAPRLARILRVSAYFWAIWLTLCVAAFGVVTLRCSGNWLYGFTDCTGLSDATAATLISVAAQSFAGGIAFFVLLLIGGGIAEVVARKRA